YPQQPPPGYQQQPPPYGYPQQHGRPGPSAYGGFGQYPAGQPDGPPPPGGPPPRKKNTGLIVGIAIAAVLLVGTGVTLPVVLLNSDDSSQSAASPASAESAESSASADQNATDNPDSGSPGADSGSGPGTDRDPESGSPSFPGPDGGNSQPADDKAAVKQVTRQALNAAADLDFDKMRSLACDPSTIPEPPQKPSQKPDVEIDIGEPTINGDHATIPIKVTASGQ